jgi:tRNA A-37 threonylcarbamoyl transferase component Bud32
MAQAEGLSCPICLQADEPESMVHVEIAHGAVVREQRVAICRQCVEAIGRAVHELASAGGAAEVANGAAADEQAPAAIEPNPSEGETP